MNSPKTISNDFSTNLILILAILLGAWLRLTPAAQAGFPINDGGMLYTMIGDLQKNAYSLPAFTTYNAAENIPFAYPPFSLYLAALLNDLLHIPIMQILQWLPGLTSIGVVLAFYLMSKALLGSRLQAALATLFFALIPRTFSWFLMGGGLTRSFGQLFLMLTAVSAYFLFIERSRRYLILTIITGALAVLSHPEAAVHTVGIVLLIWFFKARTRAAFLNSLIVAFGVGTATALWWLPILSQHGVTPFLNAAQTGNHTILAWLPLLKFDFSQEPLLPLITFIGLIGLFVSLAKRNFFFVAFLLLPFILEPRSAPWIATMPLAMLTALALTDLLLPALASLGAASPTLFENKVVLTFLGCLIAYSLLGSYAFALKMGTNYLRESDRGAMTWITSNTSPGSRFLTLTSTSDPMNDSVLEWFPALAQRNSQTTLQGKEWTWGAKFISSISEYQKLQACSLGIICVEAQAEKLGLSFEYVYVTLAQCTSDENCQQNNAILVESLKKSPHYQLTYKNDGALVFKAITHNTAP